MAEVIAPDSDLHRLAAHGARFVLSREGEAIPAGKWKGDEAAYLTADEAQAQAGAGRFIMAVLDRSDLAVIDIDRPDHDHAKEIMATLDRFDAPYAYSRRGVHYYVLQDSDLESVLQGRTRMTLRASTRKNATPVGDVITELATCYRFTHAGEFKPFGAYEGLYGLLTHADQPAPSERAGQIEADVAKRMRALRPGERNNGAYALMCSANRRLKQAGAIRAWADAGARLAAVYDEVNPENAGHFSPDKLDEINEKVGVVKPVASMEEAADITEAVLNAYLADHAKHVILSADEGRDQDREVFEWDVAEERWGARKAGVVAGGCQPLRATLRDLYCEIYADVHGERPLTFMRLRDVDNVISCLKDDNLHDSPRMLYDQPKDGVMYLQGAADGRHAVYRIDARAKTTERMDGNKPEYMLLAEFGAIETPREGGAWLCFLRDVLGDDDTMHFFGQVIASAFVPVAEPRIIICNGAGANGKSVLLSALNRALGEFATDVTFDALAKVAGGTDKRQLDGRRRMVGKRIAVCTETDSSPLDMAFIKALTSGELIEVGGMYRKSTHVPLDVVPLLATNELPRIYSISHAVRRRLSVIPFDRRFGEGGFKPADPHMIDALRESAPEMRGWLIGHIQQFLKAGEIVEPKRVAEATDHYMESSRHEVERMLEVWLDVLPRDKRAMKLGRKEGSGRNARYTGVMRLAMLVQEQAGLNSKPPSRPLVKGWLEKRNIISDERGRLNCQPSRELVEFLTEEVADQPQIHEIWESILANKICGMERPSAPTAAQADVRVVDAAAQEPEEFRFNE